MSSAGIGETLESWVPTLLVVTGVLYVIAALNTAVVYVSPGYDFQPVSAPLLLVGLVASLLALVGIASRGSHAGSIARATKLVAGVAALVALVLLGWGLASEYGPLADSPMVLSLVGIVLFIASFALAGWTVLRAGIYEARVGYLLVAEALALVGVIVGPVLVFGGEVPEAYIIAIELVQALFILWAAMGIRATATGDAGSFAWVGEA